METARIIARATVHVVFNFVIVTGLLATAIWVGIRYYERRQS